MFNKYDGSKIFLIGISVGILIGTFAVGSQVVQQSLAQDSSRMGQDVERNENGNQTANQSAEIGDPAKMYVPRGGVGGGGLTPMRHIQTHICQANLNYRDCKTILILKQ